MFPRSPRGLRLNPPEESRRTECRAEGACKEAGERQGMSLAVIEQRVEGCVKLPAGPLLRHGGLFPEAATGARICKPGRGPGLALVGPPRLRALEAQRA